MEHSVKNPFCSIFKNKGVLKFKNYLMISITDFGHSFAQIPQPTHFS